MKDIKEGMRVRFSPPHFGFSSGVVVQVNKDVMLTDASGETFIREKFEILHEIEETV